MKVTPLLEGSILLGKKNKHRYQIKRYLGRGGFGITYLAQEKVTAEGIPQTHTFTIKEFCLSNSCSRGADGAILVEDGKQADFDEAKKEFAGEADLLHHLSNAGIVPVSEVFEQNNTVYYVMQYLGDTSLSNLIAKSGDDGIEEALAVSITRKIACSLRYLHQHRMTHLDVKPDNIMLLKDGSSWQPVLIDFGLARSYGKDGRLVSKMVAVGTSQGYSPVEQYEPEGLDSFTPQADIYALGATLFCMLTGKAPLASKDISAKQIFTQLPDGLSDNTSNVLVMAMQKRKEDRPADMDAFLQLLGTVDEPDNADDGNVTERADGKRRSRIVAVDKKYLLMLLAAIAIVTVLFFLIPKMKPYFASTPDDVTQTPDTVITKTDTLTVEKDTTTVSPSHVHPQQPSSNTQHQDISSSPSTTTTHVVTPSKPVEEEPVITVKDFGYAVWHGSLAKGKPDGEGRMVFKKAHVIDSFDPDKSEAERGDYVEGVYQDGHLVSGKWYDANGNEKKSIYIGGL